MFVVKVGHYCRGNLMSDRCFHSTIKLLVKFWMRGARSGAGSDLGVGTNFNPRERTSVSAVERGSLERFMTVLEELFFVMGFVEGKGTRKVG